MIPNYLESSLLKDLLQNTYDTLASNMYAGKINILCFKGYTKQLARTSDLIFLIYKMKVLS